MLRTGQHCDLGFIHKHILYNTDVKIFHDDAKDFTMASKPSSLMDLIRDTDLNTFKQFALYFLIGFATLCYWESTWSSIDLLQRYLHPSTLYAIVYSISLTSLFIIALSSPLLVRYLKHGEIETFHIHGKVNPGELECSKTGGNADSGQIHNSADDKVKRSVWPFNALPIGKDSCKSVYIGTKLKKLSSILQVKIAVYLYNLFLVGSWFAPWGLIDLYSVGKLSPTCVHLIVHTVATLTLIACQRLRLVVMTPFHAIYETDLGINLLLPFLGRKDVPKPTFQFLISCVTKVFFFGNLVFMFWYSVWGLSSQVAAQILPDGLSSLPTVVLPFISFMAFIPNFFVLSHLATTTKNFLTLTLLSYFQGLANVIFWMCFWIVSARLVPADLGIARHILQHFLSFGILAAFGTAVNYGI